MQGSGMQGAAAPSSSIRIRVSDLLFALQKRWMIIVALSLVGLTFGLILSAMTLVQSSLQTYVVYGSFALTTQNSEGLYIGNAPAANNNDFHLAEDMVDAAKYIIRSDHVMNEVINSQELLGYTVSDLKGQVSLGQYNTTQIMEMSVSWRNADEGVAIWNGIVESASALMPQTLQLGTLAVINEPTAEPVGVAGASKKTPVILTMLGFAAGVGFALIELLMHPTLNNVRDVETMFGLETIGIIPQNRAYYNHKGSLLAREDVGTSNVEQNFSAAAYILRNRLGTREKHHCFYVTSATVREGKSTVAANLAIQLSDMEHRTLLIDFDTRNPSLGALFLNSVDYGHSLNALYRGDATEEEAITTLTGYLDILPAVLEHNTISMDSTIVELIERLEQKYEYVILDAPPVGMVSDTLSLNQVANTVLFVIGYDNSTIPEIQNALEKLDKSGIRVLGCVVNNVQSGRGLSINQSAEDHRKSILKKSKEKRENEERFGLPAQDDDGSREELLKSSGAGKRVSKRKPGKGERLFGGRRKKNAEAEAGPSGPSAVTPPRLQRNVLDDVTEEAPAERNDEDVIDALLSMNARGKPGDAPAAEEGTASAQSDSAPAEHSSAQPESGEEELGDRS